MITLAAGAGQLIQGLASVALGKGGDALECPVAIARLVSPKDSDVDISSLVIKCVAEVEVAARSIVTALLLPL